MPKRTVSFRSQLLEDLTDPAEAALYLSAAAEDSDEMLLVALRDVAEAKQMSQVAEQAGVARESLYRMLSKSGNPRYNSLTSILNALRLRMYFAPLEVPASGSRALGCGSLPSLETEAVHTERSEPTNPIGVASLANDIIPSTYFSVSRAHLTQQTHSTNEAMALVASQSPERRGADIILQTRGAGAGGVMNIMQVSQTGGTVR